jgi:alkaline phosphatase
MLLICGPLQTYNGGIAVDEDGNPCGTVLEAAHFAGYKTGLVATSRITVCHPHLVGRLLLTDALQHATPASFASHIYDRDQEWIIAEQLVGNTPLGPVVDFQLGGGRGFFLPNGTTGSTRPDKKDIIEYARNQGYTVILDRAGFDDLQFGNGEHATKPYIGLFHNSHMNYEVGTKGTSERVTQYLCAFD